MRYHYVGLQIRHLEGKNFNADPPESVKDTRTRNREKAAISANVGKKHSTVTSSDCTFGCEDFLPRNPEPALEGCEGSDNNSDSSAAPVLSEMLPSSNPALSVPFLFTSLYNASQLQTISFDQLDDCLPNGSPFQTKGAGNQWFGLEEHLAYLSRK